MELDKAIYGIKKGVNDKKYYERIENLFNYKKDINDDFKQLSKYQKLLSGGQLIKISLSKNTKAKEIMDIIEKAIEHDIGFLKFEVRK